MLRSVPASIFAAKLFSNPAFLLTAKPIQKPVVPQLQKSAESSKASKFSPEFAIYMIGLIKDRTANSTVIAELEEAIRSNTVSSDARLPTETATSLAASGAISSVAIATSSGASSNAAGAILSGAFGAYSNAAGAMSPAASGAASSVPLESAASPQPAVLVHPVVVTQPAAMPHSAAVTPHAAAATPHSTVVTQPAATLHTVAATPHVAASAPHTTVVTACRYPARRCRYAAHYCRRIELNRRVAACCRSPSGRC